MRRDRDQRGASVLELAIFAPVFLFLIFFSIQAALYFYGRNVALQSAREAVADLRLSPHAADFDKHKAGTASDVRDYASGLGGQALLNPTVTPQYLGTQGKVSVTVTGQVISLVPGLDLSVSQTAEGPIERFGYGDELDPNQ